MEKFKLDEQKLNSLKTYKDKGLRTVIGCVWALSIFTIGALSTVENGAKAEINDSGWAIESEFPFEIKSDNAFCEAEIKQELRNIIWWIQDEIWFMELIWINWRCDYEIERVERAVNQRKATERAIHYWEWEWYPGKLNAEWTSQEMPEVKWTDSHQRFKELCQAYWLDAWMFREIENEYNIREGVLLSIVIAETSWGKYWYGTSSCNNPANNNNNDRWTRVCYDSFREWLIEAAKTLNNSYLGWIQTLGCLSKAGSCKRREDKGYVYASSNGNWERNMLNALNLIYEPELWQIDAERFNVRRTFTVYQ